jgi:hypothetical protein
MSADHFSFGFVGLVDDEPTRLLLELLRELPAAFLGLFDFLGHLLLLRPDRRSYQIQTILRVRFAKEDQKPISSVRCIQVVEMSGPDILPDSPCISRGFSCEVQSSSGFGKMSGIPDIPAQVTEVTNELVSMFNLHPK